MITVSLILKVGRVKNHLFQTHDEYEIEDYETIHEILDVVADPISDRAVLLVHVTGWPDEGRTLASFKRIKVKSKGKSVFKWVVVE